MHDLASNPLYLTGVAFFFLWALLGRPIRAEEWRNTYIAIRGWFKKDSE